MAIIEVPWINLPQTKFKQLNNGMRGVVFKLSPMLVGKILYGTENEDYWLRDDDKAIKELEYEVNINKILYENNIGNVPKPVGIELLGMYRRAYPTFVMEYIKLPHGDELDYYDNFTAENLVKNEIFKASDIFLFPGKDYLNPRNYFYDKNKQIVRLIDFGLWTIS